MMESDTEFPTGLHVHPEKTQTSLIGVFSGRTRSSAENAEVRFYVYNVYIPLPTWGYFLSLATYRPPRNYFDQTVRNRTLI